MSKKNKVEDSELEKVTGGAGIMSDPQTEKLDQVITGPGDGGEDFETHNYDLGNDMIITDGDRD